MATLLAVAGMSRSVAETRIDARGIRNVEFTDTPLSLAVAEFNLYSRMPIVVGTPRLENIRVSGLFRTGDTAAFLFSLREVLNIETRKTRQGVVLIGPKEAPMPTHLTDSQPAAPPMPPRRRAVRRVG